jgi:uncharacterized protein HemY
MDWSAILLVLTFFGGLVLFFGFGLLITHLTGLDKYYDQFIRTRKRK